MLSDFCRPGRLASRKIQRCARSCSEFLRHPSRWTGRSSANCRVRAWQCSSVVTNDDTGDRADTLAAKLWRLRILDGERSAADADAPLLVISQFTLYADTRKGRRPSWSAAAPAEVSEPLYDRLCESLVGLGATVERGVFGAMMQVALVNDGPMTVIVDV
jgi:D-tyrosyl-tRNA(Tyr) deacylase